MYTHTYTYTQSLVTHLLTHTHTSHHNSLEHNHRRFLWWSDSQGHSSSSIRGRKERRNSRVLFVSLWYSFGSVRMAHGRNPRRGVRTFTRHTKTNFHRRTHTHKTQTVYSNSSILLPDHDQVHTRIHLQYIRNRVRCWEKWVVSRRAACEMLFVCCCSSTVVRITQSA